MRGAAAEVQREEEVRLPIAPPHDRPRAQNERKDPPNRHRPSSHPHAWRYLNHHLHHITITLITLIILIDFHPMTPPSPLSFLKNSNQYIYTYFGRIFFSLWKGNFFPLFCKRNLFIYNLFTIPGLDIRPLSVTYVMYV